ncbi:MAG TPA: TspO/MBR family protein [Candidatus Paceibacterota bacterium]|nr:TspO/MBR family protein [Candidatus Paceibacterota bacterium]
MRTYAEFYQSVVLPAWAPPAWLFGVAWGIIYPLFIIATVLTVVAVVRRRAPRSMLWLLAANWVANLLFTPIQLGLTPLWPASVDILVVLGTLVVYQRLAWRHLRWAFWLLVPYLLWGAFATVLQLTITLTN